MKKRKAFNMKEQRKVEGADEVMKTDTYSKPFGKGVTKKP